MKLKKTTFETAPQGTFAARIICLADLGLQDNPFGAPHQKLGITFELASKRTQAGTPFAVFERFTLSLNEKAKLYEIVRAALGTVPDELDLKDIMGKAVLVSIVHRESGGKTWANVATVTELPEGMTVSESPTEALYFDLESPDPATFGKLPALFRTMIEKRTKPTEPPESGGDTGDFDDDVAF